MPSTYAYGKVIRIYPNEVGAYIKLDASGLLPKHGYFQLLKTHPNYNSLYSLTMVAAVNRYHMKIRVVGNIQPNKYAKVSYMTVDW